VDDQKDIRRLLLAGLSTLSAIQVEIVDVPSAEEAMLVATSGTFDLMVSDVRLSGFPAWTWCGGQSCTLAWSCSRPDD
jgi:CheY-like chemotaxis protein